MSGLLEIYRRHVSDASTWSPSEQELVDLCERAEAAFPTLGHSRAVFAKALAERGEMPTDVGELYLAAASASGSTPALELLAANYLGAANEAVRHMKLPPALADDVRQKTSEKLLVPGDDGVAKIVRYAGQGKLRGLIKVIAVRTALSELRKHGHEVAFPASGPDIFAANAAPDAELAFVKERYRAEFKVAFENAVDALTERERNLLRLHLLRGVTLAALADIYGVHRASVTRWLTDARKKLMETTRARLGERLELGRGEIDSVMAWIGSRLDASVSRVLRTRAGDGAD